MIGPSGLVEKTCKLSLLQMTNEVPSVLAQRHPFLENKHPSVQLLWHMLEKDIPETNRNEITCKPSTRFQKSIAEAADLRSLGSKFYDLRNFDEAMMYYCKCVATAPVDSEELALAYGNRSAIHLFRKNYELCLLDLNRALHGTLPQSTRQILLKRKAMTWEKLQEQNILRSKLREGISHVKCSDGEKANLRACERQLCYVSQVGIDDVDLMIDHSLIDDPIWQTKFKNTVLGNVSPKIELKYDAEFGLHLVAKEDIDPGEILCIDELYSAIVFENLRFQYCGYCYVQCEALIACFHCTWELYCSNSCRLKAFDSYHRIECKMLPLWNNISNYHLAGRLLLLRTFLRVTKQGSELAHLMNDPFWRESVDGILNCANLHLTHDHYPMLVHAVSILRYSNHGNTFYHQGIVGETLPIFAGLRYLQFFGNESTETQYSGNVLNAQEYFGSLLLVYHAALLWAQSFPVEHHMVESMAEPCIVRSTFTGHGFSLLKCFTHHSCDPNVHRIVNKRHVLMYSVRSIRAGEQIAPIDHFHFMQCPRDKRQQMFKGFCGQECTCKACAENWPTLAELTKHKEKYHIRNKKMIAKIERMTKWRNRIHSCSISEDNLRTALEFSKTLRQYVKEPSAIICHFENYIEKVMKLKGNLYVDPKYIALLCNNL